MRMTLAGLVLALFLFATGCRWFTRQDNAPDASTTKVFGGETPTEKQLVEYVNERAKLVSTLKCRTVDIDIKENGKTQPGVRAIMVCQKPRDFRLQGKAAVGSVVDIGSNKDELWFWIKYMEPEGVYHCSYDDLANGKVKSMPLPIQPEWVVQVMGIAEFNDDMSKYKVIPRGDFLELQEQTVSPQGQPVTRVTIFNCKPSAGKPLVCQHHLLDANRKMICWAEITEVQQDRSNSRVVLPTQLRMVWPDQKIEIKMKIDDDFKVNDPIDAKAHEDLFTRRNLADLPSYDLARGPDGPAGLRRAAGTER
ncbi:MAG: hypothetical protein ACJ8FY_11560 [Gemmataceae bacterium]